MRGLQKLRLPNDLWAEIDRRNLRNSETGNGLLTDAIHLAFVEIARKVDALGLNRSNRKQAARFFRYDTVVVNGHPAQDSIENLKNVVEQASDEYRTYVLTKHIRMLLRKREEGL